MIPHFFLILINNGMNTRKEACPCKNERNNWINVLHDLMVVLRNTDTSITISYPYDLSPRILLASWISLGIIVTRLA